MRTLRTLKGPRMDRRARIMDAMIAICCERGFSGATVAAVCRRARVSRRGFYDEFDGLRDCFLAVMDDGRSRASALIADAFASVEDGEEGVAAAMAGARAALAALLCFFDGNPGIARVWVVESLAAGAWAIERRERNVTALTEQIVRRWEDVVAERNRPLVATGTMAAVLGLLQRRMVDDRDEPLLDLLPSLMEIVAAPYLAPGAVVAQVERARALVRRRSLAGERARASRAGRASGGVVPADSGEGTGAGLPSALLDPRARRARQCVAFLARRPGASNRAIADGIGVVDHSQMSTLLARLERLGLVRAERGSPGHANSWRLTPVGEDAARVLGGDDTPIGK